jgi:protein gp37
MSGKTKIEWATDQWNPVTGCSKVSQGCKHCYAEREWPRLSAPRAKPNIYTGRAFTDVKCHPEKLDIPLRWQKPRRIFVNSMSDLFHESVPDEFIRAVFGVMALAPHHTFQVLTKRADRMRDWLTGLGNNPLVYRYGDPGFEHIAFMFKDGYPETSWPLPNVWLGVSVEDQATADERVPLLLQTPAAVRWISAEPLLGQIDLSRWLEFVIDPPDCLDSARPIDWVVVGGESGPHARPMHPDWVRSLRDQCHAAGTPFFFKQWGEWSTIENMDEMAIMTTPGHAPGHKFADGTCVYRCGKRRAGRELDGVMWDEYPR